MLRFLILVALLAPIPLDSLDHDGQAAFGALRAYQRMELAAWQTRLPTPTWPTPVQHQAIRQALDAAYEGVIESLALGADLDDANGTPPQVVSLMIHAQEGVKTLMAQVNGATPATVRTQLRIVQMDYAALMAHFPATGPLTKKP